MAGESLNLNSPRQLAIILFEKQQLPVLKRTKSGPPAPTPTCWSSSPPWTTCYPRLILDYRELQKLKSTYVDTLPGDRQPPHRPYPYELQPDRRRHLGLDVVPVSQVGVVPSAGDATHPSGRNRLAALRIPPTMGPEPTTTGLP